MNQELFSWGLIGTIVGMLMGLTGAGGGVVGVPLFSRLLGVSLKEATVLSLTAVLLGAVLNWWLQRKNTRYAIGLPLFALSIVGASAARPMKAVAPDWVIVLIFVVVGFFSITAVWKKQSPKKAGGSHHDSRAVFFLKSSVGGATMGALVTLTGLGGGVILVPLLRGVFGLALTEAAATSLFVILLSAIFSISMQWESVAGTFHLKDGLVLALGTIAAAFLVKRMLKGIEPARVDLARKVVLTGVIVAACGSLVLSTL